MRSVCVCISFLKKVNAGDTFESMSWSVMEQRLNIKFCFKLEKTASEIHDSMKFEFGAAAMSCSSTLEWHARFRDGKEITENDQ